MKLHLILQDKSKLDKGSKLSNSLFIKYVPMKMDRTRCQQFEINTTCITCFLLLHAKFLQFDWLRAAVFQLKLKYLHVKITNLLRVVL